MFKDDFVWGVATSAYQIEGRDADDGAGVCIWDEFAKSGRVYEGHDGSVACDHIHRYKEDYALMRLLGVKAYRFSISWARVMPTGTGEVNEKAIALYRDMMKEMIKNGITPYITMYHWELPQALQNKGGWLNEDLIGYFGEYARVVAENFSDLSEHIITFNEPQCFIGLGYLTGGHAPGLKLSPKDVFQITHNVLRAHGTAVKQLRKYAKHPIKIGFAPTCGVAYPYTDSKEDIEAARSIYFGFDQPINNWTWNVPWFSDPVFLGKYPEEGLEKYKDYLPEITKEDMELIYQPIDFMGQNIYNGYFVRCGKDGKPEYVGRSEGFPKTATNWPVTPDALYWGAKFLYERYKMPLYITENGMSAHDWVSEDGRVHDYNRIDFLDKYLSSLQRASDDGVDLRGYFLWSFLDNFEWEKGYSDRFGIVYVDFATQKRIAKDSAYWYKEVMETNGKNLSINGTRTKGEILFVNPVSEPEADDRNNRSASEQASGSNGTVVGWHSGCIVKEGRCAGKSLGVLWTEKPELFGNSDNSIGSAFPHPDDGRYKQWTLEIDGSAKIEQEYPFLIMNVIEGDGLINGQYIKKGDCFILPNGFGTAEFTGSLKITALSVLFG